MKLMKRTKSKRTPLVPTLEEAQAAARDLAGQRRTLDQEIVGMEAMLALDATTSDAVLHGDRLAALRERAEPFMDIKPRKIRGRLEDARDDLKALLPKVFAANEAASSGGVAAPTPRIRSRITTVGTYMKVSPPRPSAARRHSRSASVAFRNRLWIDTASVSRLRKDPLSNAAKPFS